MSLRSTPLKILAQILWWIILSTSANILNCTCGLKRGTTHWQLNSRKVSRLFLFYLSLLLSSGHTITQNPLCLLSAVYFRSVGWLAPQHLCMCYFLPVCVCMGGGSFIWRQLCKQKHPSHDCSPHDQSAFFLLCSCGTCSKGTTHLIVDVQTSLDKVTGSVSSGFWLRSMKQQTKTTTKLYL